MKTTGEKIRELRNVIDMSQNKLAEELGVGLRTLQRYESDESDPDKFALDIDEFYCYCQDDYWNKKEYKLFKVDEIDKISRELLVFSFETVNGLCKYKMNEAIAEAIRRYDEKQCLKIMRLFVEDFSKNFDFDKEIPEGDPVCSKAIMYLKGLGDDKKICLNFLIF